MHYIDLVESYTFVGYNSQFAIGVSTLKTYTSYDHVCAGYVKDTL